MVGYELYATGNTVQGNVFKMYSKQVYSKKEDAESNINYFKKRCCSDRVFERAVEDSLKIRVIEKEIILRD